MSRAAAAIGGARALAVASALSIASPARAEVTEITVTGDEPLEGRPSSRVGKRDLDERLPRSAPDALRWEPGVFVQQSAHGQASPFLRGRTGQQTLLLFDGIRLNNSTFRQGPNQYFFTVDARSVRSIEVIRGGASTLFGTDAIGGVVHARPLEPSYEPGAKLRVLPRAASRFGSADGEFGQRFQLDAQLGDSVLAIAGVGWRRVGRLRSGGVVRGDGTGEVPQVPAFEDDGKTMLGTGFKELTSDVRVVYRLPGGARLVGAAYLYRQYDAPRTDQCPPAFAPRSECLIFEEQFRTLTYLAWEGPLGGVFQTRVALSYQRQHERRRRDRPTIAAQNGGRDDVDTVGLVAQAVTTLRPITDWWRASVAVGADVYADSLRSTAWTRFTDLEVVLPASRGQYVSGSRYATGGVFARVGNQLGKRLGIKLAGRAGFASADAPGDAPSGTVPVTRTWLTHGAFVQAEWAVRPDLSVLGTWDRSFRAPNLDDLTSRQQTGPGFQLENAGLRPETADTFEAGVRAKTAALLAELWVFRSVVHDAITRSLRAASDCPPGTPTCGASWTRYQLVNASGPSIIDGVEVAARAQLPYDLTLRATLAYAYGRGPNPQERPTDPRVPYEHEVPLSRISPINGTFEARWVPPLLSERTWVAFGLRWAGPQTRLAPSDRSDARIPEGGTPGFAVVDLRAGYRFERHILVTVIVENVGDSAYRYHGSSINGPGRSVLFSFEAGL